MDPFFYRLRLEQIPFEIISIAKLVRHRHAEKARGFLRLGADERGLRRCFRQAESFLPGKA